MGTLRPKYILYGYMEPLGEWCFTVPLLFAECFQGMSLVLFGFDRPCFDRPVRMWAE